MEESKELRYSWVSQSLACTSPMTACSRTHRINRVFEKESNRNQTVEGPPGSRLVDLSFRVAKNEQLGALN